MPYSMVFAFSFYSVLISLHGLICESLQRMWNLQRFAKPQICSHEHKCTKALSSDKTCRYHRNLWTMVTFLAIAHSYIIAVSSLQHEQNPNI